MSPAVKLTCGEETASVLRLAGAAGDLTAMCEGTLATVSATRWPLFQNRRNQVRLGSSERQKVTYTSHTSSTPSPKAIWLMLVSLPSNSGSVAPGPAGMSNLATLIVAPST